LLRNREEDWIPLTTQLEFYRARAAQCRAEADEATLDNVRERCLRAEDAWNQMADRAARTEAMRREREGGAS
jgi:hypothetical protein